jgi:pyruvate dehydrogenase E2 component (dihydrolipoamide acetyltransferase)
VKQFVKGIVSRGGAGREGQATGQMPDFSKWGEVEREKLSRIRSVIAENTGHAWSIVPHVTQFDEADITELEEFRKKYGSQVEQAGGKLTVTAILLKIVTEALKRFPRFNASIDTVAGEIIKKKYYHIGVAVDTENGLLVPVIRDVDRKDLEELSVELTELAERTRERKVDLEEMEGGTFTVSNQGGIGGVGFTPIVFWPQVAILGVSRAQERAVFREGTFVPRTILPLALSYDHRIVDGADAARCLRWIVEALEHPLLLQLDR